MRNPLHVHELLQEYGDIVLWRGLSDLYFVNHPDLLRPILSRDREHFSKQTLDYRVVAQYMGNGLACSDGALWARQRRLIEPFFSQKNLERFDDAINTTTSTLMDEWDTIPAGKPVWLDQEMRRLVLRTAGVTTFGLDVESNIDQINEIIDIVNRQPRDIKARMTLHPWIPTPHNLKMRWARKQLDRFAHHVIAARWRKRSGRGDILHRLMRTPDAQKSNDKQTRDEIVTLLLSGHTTAAALVWTLHLVATHPDVEAQLAEGLATRLNGAPATAADLDRIPYLQRVVQEALRLYPPVWCYTRRSEREHEINGYLLPAKAQVGIMVYSVHRHPEFWPNAERFDPDRFQPSRSKDRHFFSYLPFGAGPRTCVGGGLAMLQIQLVLAQLLQRFKVHAVPGHPIEALAKLTLEPRYGLPVTLTRR